MFDRLILSTSSFLCKLNCDSSSSNRIFCYTVSLWYYCLHPHKITVVETIIFQWLIQMNKTNLCLFPPFFFLVTFHIVLYAIRTFDQMFLHFVQTVPHWQSPSKQQCGTKATITEEAFSSSYSYIKYFIFFTSSLSAFFVLDTLYKYVSMLSPHIPNIIIIK